MPAGGAPGTLRRRLQSRGHESQAATESLRAPGAKEHRGDHAAVGVTGPVQPGPALGAFAGSCEEVVVRRLSIVNAVLPLLVAALQVAAMRDAGTAFLLFVALAVVMLGLAAVNLVAPFLFWRRHGALALLPPALFLVAASLAGVAVSVGPKWALAHTPAMPDTFLTERRQADLGSYAYWLLTEGGSDSIEARLRAEGFDRIDVDRTRRVVTLSHAYGRTWHEYFYSPSPLGAPYSTPPRLTERDVPNWGELRFIAQQIDSSTRRRGSEVSFIPELALVGIREALGDSVLRDLARRPFGQRISDAEKQRVLDAFNRQCSVSSGLIEAPMVRVGSGVRELRIDGRALPRGSWATELLTKLLEVGALGYSQDGRHLRIRRELTPIERSGVEWVQVAIMNVIYGELLEARDNEYDRQLAEHWYYRRW